MAQERWKYYMDDSTQKLNNSSLLKQHFEPQGFCCQAPLVMYSVWLVVYACTHQFTAMLHSFSGLIAVCHHGSLQWFQETALCFPNQHGKIIQYNRRVQPSMLSNTERESKVIQFLNSIFFSHAQNYSVEVYKLLKCMLNVLPWHLL